MLLTIDSFFFDVVQLYIRAIFTTCQLEKMQIRVGVNLNSEIFCSMKGHVQRLIIINILHYALMTKGSDFDHL